MFLKAEDTTVIVVQDHDGWHSGDAQLQREQIRQFQEMSFRG